MTTVKTALSFDDMKVEWAAYLFRSAEDIPDSSRLPIPECPSCLEAEGFEFEKHVLGGGPLVPVHYLDYVSPSAVTAVKLYFKAAVGVINARARATEDVIDALQATTA